MGGSRVISLVSSRSRPFLDRSVHYLEKALLVMLDTVRLYYRIRQNLCLLKTYPYVPSSEPWHTSISPYTMDSFDLKPVRNFFPFVLVPAYPVPAGPRLEGIVNCTSQLYIFF
jgi:hypothetical protein